MRKCFAFFFLVALLLWIASVPVFAQLATPSVAALLGDTRVESQVDSNVSGQAEAFPVKATATGSVASLVIYLIVPRQPSNSRWGCMPTPAAIRARC